MIQDCTVHAQETVQKMNEKEAAERGVDDEMADMQFDTMDQDSGKQVPSMEKHIHSTNVGYRMLLKMGWKQGTGLGSTGQGSDVTVEAAPNVCGNHPAIDKHFHRYIVVIGIIDPIRINMKADTLGVGKATLDNQYHGEAVSSRKTMLAEIIAQETEDDRKAREVRTAAYVTYVIVSKKIKHDF